MAKANADIRNSNITRPPLASHLSRRRLISVIYLIASGSRIDIAEGLCYDAEAADRIHIVFLASTTIDIRSSENLFAILSSANLNSLTTTKPILSILIGARGLFASATKNENAPVWVATPIIKRAVDTATTDIDAGFSGGHQIQNRI